MNCPRINKKAGPAGWLHSLCCAECRASRRADDLLSFGIVQLRKEMNPHPALNRTLAALALPQLTENFYLRLRQRSQRRKRAAITSALLLSAGAWFVYMDALPAYLPYDEPAAESEGQMALEWAIPGNASVYSVGGGDTYPLTGIADQLNSLTQELESPRAAHLHQDADTLAEYLKNHGNKMALDTLLANLTTPYRQKTYRHSEDWQNSYALLQYFTALLHADAVWKESQGDRVGAIEEAANLITFGENISGGGSWNARFTGSQCQAYGRRLLWRQLPHLSAQEALQIAGRIEATSRLHQPLEATARWERVSQLSMEYDTLRSPFWRWQITEQSVHPSIYPISAVQHLALAVSLYRQSNRQIFQDLEDVTAQDEDQFSGPYRHVTAARLAQTSRRDPIQPLLDPWLVSNDADLATMCFLDFESETQNALLMTALAIRAYHLEHGVNPPNLKALCPNYLSQVPADPFKPGGVLQYKPQYTYDDQSRFEEAPQAQKLYPSFILYSVGPDGIDQSGTSIYYGIKGRSSRQVSPDSIGDIVAGINK